MDNECIMHDRSAKGIQSALDNLVKTRPELETIAAGFGPLLLAKAAFKEAYSLPDDFQATDLSLDEPRFDQGEPLFVSMGLMDFHKDIPRAARELMPPMKQAFTGIDLEPLENGFSNQTLDTRECLKAYLEGDRERLGRLAGLIKVSPEVFSFAMGVVVKPFMEIQAQALAPLIKGRQWMHGFCPVCGSQAAIAGLVGEGGKRWLQCAVCDHEWRFNRHTCPRCNDKDHNNHEYFFDKNNPVKAAERVDTCKACKTYLLTVDLRQKTDPVNMDVLAMGMVPLDILAQEKGYTPLASTLWNTLD